VAAIVEDGVARRVFPGAVVVVGRADTVLYSEGFGRLQWASGARRPDPETTQYDLASLTKVVATASAAMTLVDAGRLGLDDPVVKHLPGFNGDGREGVTIRMLLEHTSGLPAFAPLYRQATGRRQISAALYRVPLRYPPGSRMVYSDLNGILLGLVVEAVAGTTLDRFARAAVFGPLGMGHTGFAVADRTRVAPSLVRGGRPQPGVASDPNARAMGGVSGHAGLFATGLDLAAFAQTWLRHGRREHQGPWVQPATVARFLERATPEAGRVLGWDTPRLDDLETSPFGRLATATTFGHTGWSGTFLWFDPGRNLFLVLLTNRSLGGTNGASLRAIREIRARLSDAVSLAVACQGEAAGSC
jgi:CubicO group peptidase (beta-lactamase class C family)